MTLSGRPFVKGHGTENDFILLPDLAGDLRFDEALVRALCDRRAGIGADGVIRVVPAAGGGYFMDYRNADGSVAEMCGNGARVFARYLVEAQLEPAGSFDIVTRGGRRRASAPIHGDVTIEMGPVQVGSESVAVLRGERYPGLWVSVGNPHLVCVIAADPRTLDLSSAPGYDGRLFPDGVNVEFVRDLGPGHVELRVFERGVGETRSCGTGTVAAAAVQVAAAGLQDGAVTVDVPGGRTVVHLVAGTSARPTGVRQEFREATLTGPAVLVASGTFDPNELSGR